MTNENTNPNAKASNCTGVTPAGFKPWMLTLLIFLAGQTCAAVWWASSINEKVKGVVALEQKFSQVANRVDTALGVLKDHGTQFQTMQQQLARLQGQDDALRADISARSADRFTSKDWDRAVKTLDERRTADLRIADLQHEKLQAQITTLEKEVEKHKHSN